MTAIITKKRVEQEVTPTPELAVERLAKVKVELETLKNATVDAVIPTRGLEMLETPFFRGDTADQPLSEALAHVKIVAQDGSPGGIGLKVTERAHRQIAEKVRIPWEYYERMLRGQPGLLADNVNTWFRALPMKRLLRLMKPVTPAEAMGLKAVDCRLRLRAFLGDGYQPVDHLGLFNAVVPEVEKRGGWLKEWNLTDDHFTAKFLTQEQDVDAILKRVGNVGRINELVRQGFRIGNSETGVGSYFVDPFADFLRCTNGMICNDLRMRGAHIGKRYEEEGYVGRDTKRLEAAAIFLRIRDKVIEVMSDKTMEKLAVTFAQAAGQVIVLPEETPLLKFVEGVGLRYELNEDEIAALQERTLQEVTRAGRLSKLEVAQGMTALARDTNEPERKDELETFGWEILKDPVKALLDASAKHEDEDAVE